MPIKDGEDKPMGIRDGLTMSEYQLLAARTINPALSREQLLLHALHGLTAEVGEIHGLFQKQYQGHPIDPDHLTKEIGDCEWFVAELCTALGIDLGAVGRTNIDKLRKRFPTGFDTERSVHREAGDV